MIRTRAHLSPLATVTLQDIKNEKRLELCLESVRYQDLVRWGDAKATLGNQGAQIPSLTPLVCNGSTKIYLWLPGPKQAAAHTTEEIELNPNISQNEGWK
jgi:hypothetical protein